MGNRMRSPTAEHDCDFWSLRITSISNKCIGRLIGKNRAGLKTDPEKWQQSCQSERHEQTPYSRVGDDVII
jgi:hypothetical protein